MQAEKWVVGDEYDEVAFARLKRALSDLQYAARDQWSGLAGSQDSETYVGLSVEGHPSLIAELKAQYKQTV
jgi:hypothetical protein